LSGWQGESFQGYAASLDGLVRVRDLSSGMVTATIFFAETLMFQGVDMGVVYLLSWYELVEGVGSVRWASK
jgi:hypothetical protein